MPDFPLVEPGDDLVELIARSLALAGETLHDGDVLALAQKIVSKSENRYVDLCEITPSDQALRLAEEVDKDPRLVEVILGESTEVVRHKPGVLVVAHRLGLVLANAGVDHSNIQQFDIKPSGTQQADRGGEAQLEERVLLLPKDPDASASSLRVSIQQRLGADVGVLITDSLGRAWRRGTVGVAIGAAGLVSLSDQRGDLDLFGRELRVTEVGHGDELAAAASIVMGQASEASPVVLIRGDRCPGTIGPASDQVRPKEEDLFR